MLTHASSPSFPSRGVGLVAACDMAIGSRKAIFSLSEVKLGLIPATISPYVINAIGQRSARRYFLTAERFDVDKVWIRYNIVLLIFSCFHLHSSTTYIQTTNTPT